jgi:amino acid transporter
MNTVTAEPAAAAQATEPRLRKNALGFPQLLAQSVALISPTMTAVLIIPLAFADAGDGTWFAYFFATIMLLFVVFGLNQFAKRSATTGSMYAYTARGLGPSAGVMSGWALVWCYFFIGVAGLCGFALMSEQLFSALGFKGTVSPFLLFAISAGIGFTIAWKDVRLSAVLTLILEGLSVACILALSAVILFKHGFVVDTKQIELKGANLKDIDFAVVVCIFSLVGFEAASTMGGEAKNPLRNVPRAVIWSLLLTGAFMVIMCYVEVFGAEQQNLSLGSLSAPLQTLSGAYGVSFFKVPVSLGGMVSFFALTLSCVNSGTRLLLPLGKHGFVSSKLHTTHERNLTPHTAIGLYYIALLAFAFLLHAVGTGALTLFGDAGTLAAFGFLCAYFMITIAAPFYLRRLGELKASHIAMAIAGCLCLMVPLVGSFYPAPPWPLNIFPALFVVYMLLGGSWLYALNRRAPGTLTDIENSLEAALDSSLEPASDIEHGSRVALGFPAMREATPAGTS